MNRTFQWKKISIALACGVLGILSLAAGLIYARAFWDDSAAVHIRAKDIENSTLAIGTHLVHLSALNDSIYEVAQTSAEESGQNRIYYKSELGGDVWFDITAATSLADITTEGAAVNDEEIEELFFTHHTKSDQVTYDLRTGEAVNIFDIKDPYDLESLEELRPLKTYHDQIIELDDENEVTRRIEQVWKTDVSTPPPDVDVEGLQSKETYDGQLAGLQSTLQAMSAGGATAEETGKVNLVMEAVDAGRRYLVFANLEVALEEYLDELSEKDSDDEKGDDEEKTDLELVSAITESLNNVRSAMITCAGNLLSEGVSVMSSAVYKYSLELINGSGGDAVRNLLLLDNIQNDVISDRAAELRLLENELIPKATQEYLNALGQGESPDYMMAKSRGDGEALLNRFRSEYDGLLSSQQGELEFLLDAKCKRIDNQSAMEFMKERQELAVSSLIAAVRNDDFSDIAFDSVNEHIVFAADRMRDFELSLGGNEMDQLMEEKAGLQTERLSALDKNDLVTAQTLEKEIEEIEEKIRAIEDEYSAQIAALQERIAGLPDGSPEKASAEADLKNLQSSLSDGSLGSMIAQMKDNALDAIKEGSSREAEADVNALAGMLSASPTLALPALQEVYHALRLNGGDDALIKTVEQAILESPAALYDELSAKQIRKIVEDYFAENGAETSGSGSGNGTQGGSTIGTDGINQLLGVGGISFRNARFTAAAIIALNLYYEETGNPAAQQVMASLAQEQVSLGNPMVYERINDPFGEFLPLTSVQVLTGRRFVWNKNESQGVLAQGADYYGFTVYSALVLRDRDGERTEQMLRPAKYQNGLHAPEEYIYDQFGIQTVYLREMTLGCACDDEMLNTAEGLLTQLLSAS